MEEVKNENNDKKKLVIDVKQWQEKHLEYDLVNYYAYKRRQEIAKKGYTRVLK